LLKSKYTLQGDEEHKLLQILYPEALYRHHTSKRIMAVKIKYFP